MAAYRHGRPHVGYQALMANALLTFQGALGYVTELLSGDFNAPFGRSSHHQVWSEAMVVTPLVRGLLGVEAERGRPRAHVRAAAPRRLAARAAAPAERGPVAVRLRVRADAGPRRVQAAAAARSGRAGPGASGPGTRVSRDARVRSVTVDGRGVRFESAALGDVQRVEASVARPGAVVEVVVSYEPGTDVSVPLVEPEPGAASQGARIVRARAERGVLRLVLDGVAGRRHALQLHTPHKVGAVAGVSVAPGAEGRTELRVAFEGPEGTYVRRELTLPLH